MHNNKLLRIIAAFRDPYCKTKLKFPEAHLQPSRISMIGLFCENSKQVKTVNYFHKKAPS